MLEEQKNQILSLEQLGLKPYPGARPGARPGAPTHPGARLPVTREELVEEDDDTTVSSLAYDEELSTLSEVNSSSNSHSIEIGFQVRENIEE